MSDHRAAMLAAITNITDAAKFEDLVRSALPSVDPRFRGLTPTGVGAHGKTVRDPVDGIGLVWNDSGPVWVGLGATTQQKKVIAKLGEDYNKLIQAIPNNASGEPRAIVALATNTAISSAGVKTLVQRGQEDALQVYVVDANKLADILTERENHGLAHAFLGVRPRLANAESLRQASEHSLDALEASLFGPPDLMPQNPVLDRLDRATGSNLIELVGASGQGKTTTVAQFGRRIATRGGIVVHVPEAVVEHHTVLNGAIDAALKSYGLDFDDSPGSFITSGHLSTEVLIVVDDVQRLAAPQMALDKVRSWSRQVAKSGVANLRILCTQWPQASDLSEEKRPHSNRISSIYPSRSDLAAYARTASSAFGHDLSGYDAGSIVENLGDDPLLLGVHLETAQQRNEIPTPREVWMSFIERGTQRAAEESHLTSVETRAAWDWLGDTMLANGSLPRQPELMTIAHEAGHAKGLAALLQSALLVRSMGETVQFRHDRLRDWHVGSRILAHHHQSHLAEAWSSIWDPYFNQGIADALHQSQYDEGLLTLVAAERPEALFGTLRDPNVATEALKAMREWAVANKKTWHLEPGVQFAVRSIMGVRHPSLPPILEALPPWPAVLLARMAHGDVDAALTEYRYSGLGVIHPARDAALEAGLRDFDDRITDGLKRVLQEPPGDEWIGAAIDLASAAGAAYLAPLVRRAADGKPELLDHAIVYEYLAMPDDFADHGERLLREWLKRRSELDKDAHDIWIDGIRLAFANAPISREATQVLTETLLGLESGWEGAHVLHDVRTDYGAAATVRLFAQHCQGRSNIYESIWFAKTSLFGHHEKQLRRIPANPGERPAILDLAKNHEDDVVRKVATWVWFMDPKPEDLGDIEALATDENEPQAVRARVEIGDASTVPWIAEHAREWAHYIEWLVHVWGVEAQRRFEEWFDEQLVAYDADVPEHDSWYACNKVLLMAPRNDARRILEERMDRLPPVDKLVQAALCVESDALRKWAMEQVRRGPAPSPFLRYMFASYGSDRDGPRAPITSAQVRQWEPIFEYFHERDLDDLYRICRRDGDETWVRPRLQSRLWKYDRQRLCPTNEDLEDELRTELEHDRSWLGMRLIENSSASPEELLQALRRVIEGHDIEEIATSLEWPLRHWCTRDTLDDFWTQHPPSGRMGELTKRRTRYFVAMENPP